jgi:predicted metalloprotease with PDZ domain
MKHLLIILCILGSWAAAMSEPTVHYTLGMSHPATHLFDVTAEFKNLPSGEKSVDLSMPVWRSGRYVILDFAGGVQEFSASGADGKNLAWEKTDKSTWKVHTNGGGTVTAHYKVYANEFNSRTRGLNDTHAFVDGSAVLMYIEKYRKLPVTLAIVPYKDWHVTTGLDASTADGFTFGAPSYDYLVDCPMEIGNQKDFPFEVDGVPHVLSIFGEGNWNADTLVRDVAKIVKTEKDFWGEFPYKRYVFLLEATPSSGGGTEHINSCAMGINPFIFKKDSTYRNFLTLVSHEFFHTWNVKQLRPHAIAPYDFTKENYSRELWISEGTTSYYENILLYRNGMIPAADALHNIASAMGSDAGRPGNKIQSVAESSFDAWIKYWKGNQQSMNAEADYYGRGSQASMFLDLEIRQRTKNAKSLDDVMRAMYKRYKLNEGGYTLEQFQKMVEEIAGSSFQKFFDDYITGVVPYDWKTTLGYAGLEAAPKDITVKPWLGIGTQDANDRTRVRSIMAGSPAYESGIDYNDEVVALNGFRVHTADITARVSELKPGDKITLTCFQNDHLRDFTITLGTHPIDEFKVTQVKEPTDLQKAIYEGWLSTKWPSK